MTRQWPMLAVLGRLAVAAGVLTSCGQQDNEDLGAVPAVDAALPDLGQAGSDSAQPDDSGVTDAVSAGDGTAATDAVGSDDATVPECASATDCKDGAACTDPSCEAGTCAYKPRPAGAACDDGEPCSTDDRCSAKGECVGGPDNSCDDANPCTEDSCKTGYGCINKALTGVCDDGDACTGPDTCTQGKCAGKTLGCDDQNPCTTDACNPATGCIYTNATGPCDDGNPCTTGDTCGAGTCQAGPNACACQSDGDCAAKEDGNLCNGTLYCDKSKAPYVCKVNPASVVVCDTSSNSACATVSCDAKTAKCLTDLAQDGAACDADGSKCTVVDSCVAGVCKPGTALACDDQNPCTVDTCDPKGGCTATATNGASCNADDTACTAGDKCVGEVCTAGTAVVCNDQNSCTLDSCEPSTGKCKYAALSDGKACDADGDACTAGDACASGVCAPGAALVCNDQNPCTVDACDPKAGCTASATDGASCNADDTACTAGDKCVGEVCTAGTAVVCNDQNSCTLDSCEPATGKCKYAPVADGKLCDADGDACTAGDACASGVCAPGAPLVCTDNNPCTANSCDTQVGCVTTNVAGPCDADQNACTQDQCVAGVCGQGPTKTCDDKNACTVDSCNTASGLCVYDPLPQDGKACDADGTTCTVNDTCASGSCKPGAPAEAGTACSDGLYCTDGDTCNGAGGCTAGPAKDCNDGNVCTVDACTEVAQGCTNLKLAAGTACSDGLFCTVGETCSAGGVCGGGAALDCSAGGCTNGSCNEGLGKCEGTAKPDGSTCDADGSLCTQNDACASGVCVAGQQKACDDGKACTIDSCNAKTGACVFDAATNTGKACDADGNVCTAADACQADGSCKAGAPATPGSTCDDGNPCTIGDGCSGTLAATCVPGNAKSCDDGNPCTADSCVIATGTCKNDALATGAACDDGLFCTTGETCNAQGQCGGGSAKVCGEGGCILGTCDEAKNACVGQTLPDGTLCNADSNGCTKNDFCQAGVCVSGAPVNCYVPGDSCNTYSCASSGNDTYQCDSAPAQSGTACDDLLYCTVGDACDGSGVCKSGTTRDCSGKSSACTTGVCDENANVCVAQNKTDGTACSLGDVCTTGDVCKSGFCIAGSSVCPGRDDARVSNTNPAIAGTCSNWVQRPPAVAMTSGGRSFVSWSSGHSVYTRSFRGDNSREWIEWAPISQHTGSNGVSMCNGVVDLGWSGLGINVIGGNIQWDARGGERKADACGCNLDLRSWGASVRVWRGIDFSPSLPDRLEAQAVSQKTSGGYCSTNCATCCLTTAPLHLSGGASAALADGRVLHTWKNPLNQYFAAIMKPAGETSVMLLKDQPSKTAIQPAVFSSDGKFLLYWADSANVFAQKYSNLGTTDGLEFQVNSTLTGAPLSDVNEWPIASQTLPNGRYVIAWQTFDKQATQGSDIRAQLFKNEPGAKAGSEFVANTSLLGNQSRPRIAAFSDSSFAIIWQDDSGRDGNGSGIVAQWYTSSGKPVGGEVVINSTTTGDQVLPNVSVDLTTDLAVIAWIDNGDTGHVKLARYDRNGKRDNGIIEQQVNGTTAGEQVLPQLASPRVTNLQLGDGSFMATWSSQNVDADGYAVLARRYGVDGKPKGAQFQVNATTAGDQWQSDAAMDQSGNFVVVWNSVGQDGDLDGVYAQRYLNTGAKSGAEFRVPVQTANEQTRPKVAMQATGAFAVAFETYAAPGGTGYDVGLRCFNASGTALSTDVLANQFTAGAQTRPQIAAVPDGSGRYIVTWQSYDQIAVGKQDDVYARIYNGSCQPTSDAFLVNTLTDGSQGIPAIEANLDGAFTIAWQQYDNATDGFNIWAQRYDTTGAAKGAAFRVHDWTAGNQTEPAVTYLPDGSFVITYTTAGEDEDGTAIKAVKYDSTGTKTDVEWMANRTYTGAQQTSAVVGRPNGTWAYAWNSPGYDGAAGTIILRTSNTGECMTDSDCNDQNVCTDDKCNAGKCQTTNNAALCTTDNDACTTGDTCIDGLCQGTPVVCSDNNVCTADSCDATTGQCKFAGIPGCFGGCYFDASPGCGGCQCEQAVCSERPSCCSKNWDSLCVQLCNQKYGGCDKGL